MARGKIILGRHLQMWTDEGQCRNYVSPLEVGRAVEVFRAPRIKMGEVTIEDSVFLADNATIMPRLEVGSDVTVGAGALVTTHVAKNVTVVGNPARRLVEGRKESGDIGE